jgi:threonine synthase
MEVSLSHSNDSNVLTNATAKDSLNDRTNVRPLLNGATPHSPVLDPELEGAREIASNTGLSVEERLEAYGDIFDSEVGDTSMSRARNIEREVGLRQLFLKFEGGNPTGTQKDRIAFAQSMDALRRSYEAVTVATCGNYGAAMSFAAATAGLRCIVYVPLSFHTRRAQEMETQGAEIVKVNGDYENAVEASCERAERDEIYDANPGGANTLIQLQAYGQIAFEIYDELRDAPAIVGVPVSNGTTLAGIHRGFVSLHRRGKTSRIPKMFAGSSYGKNPIVHAFLQKLDRCEDLPPESIKETEVNEPLVNWHSIDGDLCLNALYQTEGWASHASDKNMLAISKKLRGAEGLSVLPASTAGLIALLDQHQRQNIRPDRYVVVLTGRRA